MANFRAIFLLMVLVPVLRATAPGVMVQVNQNGINKFLAVGCGILDNTIPGTRIPDTNGKSAPDSNSGPEAKSLFSWELSNIVIAQFHIDQNHAGVALHPTDNVGVSISNLVAEITADYHIKVGSGWLSVSKSG
uniref:Uncharacterized protein n=1 Tax=Plectus sambesii TaxID=2011161 RepID=A0A914VJA3_9BILA